MAVLPPHYPDAVVAIGVGNDPAERSWIGTGFLYGLVERKNGKKPNSYVIFLVTNVVTGAAGGELFDAISK